MNWRLPLQRYDFFKLLVALALLILGTLLSIREYKPSMAQTAISDLATETPSVESDRAGEVTRTATRLPRPSPLVLASPTFSPEQSETPSSTPTASLTATAQAVVDCPLALPTRLKVGSFARLTRNINIRSAPEISNNILFSSWSGGPLKIIGGPVCGVFGDGAYLWWQVSLPDGNTGWTAEGASQDKLYFLEPVE